MTAQAMSLTHTPSLRFQLNPVLDSNINAFALADVGIVIPKSNITMAVIGQVCNDKFHLAGTHIDVAGGLEFDFSNQYFHYQEASLTIGMRF
ncbi:MAG: hypothetical protein ACKVOY_18835 [Burkholderiaceae bacterium]|jgi:hypothetical protein